MNKNIVNLNKHAVILSSSSSEGDEAVHTVFPPSGMVASVSTKEVMAEDANGLPCVRVEYGEVQGIPDPQEGVFYIVNMLVFERSDRADLIAPDTGPSAIRFTDGPQKGNVRAVTRFKRKLPLQPRD